MRSSGLERLARDIERLLEVNREIASSQSPNSITADYTSSKDIHSELVKLYNFLANSFGYRSIDHMIAVAHTLIIAEAIANPSAVNVQVIKAIEQAQQNVRPPEDRSVAGKLPAGESKRDIAKRMNEFFKDVSVPSKIS